MVLILCVIPCRLHGGGFYCNNVAKINIDKCCFVSISGIYLLCQSETNTQTKTNKMNAQIIFNLTNELKAININPVGSYATLPKIMAQAIEDVKLFGYENWSAGSCLGEKLKNIVKKYAQF